MYRKVNSGRWIGITTAGIVIVMAVFTWVMYGMAQQVFTMTDIMMDLNESIKAMVGTQISMAADMGQMAQTMTTMNANMGEMNQNMGEMTGDIATMSGSVGAMSDAMGGMAMNMNRITYDLSHATYAISNPMSYMWGNAMPF